jgi:hypothetical protein
VDKVTLHTQSCCKHFNRIATGGAGIEEVVRIFVKEMISDFTDQNVALLHRRIRTLGIYAATS